MCSKHVRAFHFLYCDLNLLRKFDLLTHIHVVLVLNINVVVATGNAPAHSAENLVKWIYVKSSSEVTSINKKVLDLLQKLGLKHLALDYCALSNTPPFNSV